ncbi:MAG: family 78 glycoside hydrolase catalytic domain, partial [Abditibacteriota bacterium]|nr:family 78 glycoside hydrolase catalytic domain [Abditibacteriota bacterium]
MLRIKDLFLSGGRTRDDIRYCLTDSRRPRLSWSLEGDEAYQAACRIRVLCGGRVLWDTGRVDSRDQFAGYSGGPLPAGREASVELTVWSPAGGVSVLRRNILYACCEPRADWIGIPGPTDHRAVYFSRVLELKDEPLSACLYVCGLGYHHVSINGAAPDDSALEPSHSNYARTAYYSVKPVAHCLRKGSNSIEIAVAEGWRDNMNSLNREAIGGRPVEFMGPVMLWAQLEVAYAGGGEDVFVTDASWQYSFGAVTAAGIYDGETYDASRGREPRPVILREGPGGSLRPDILEPIRPVRLLPPADITRPKKGLCVLDFGENIAGVLRIPLPPMKAGQRITCRFAEELREDGTLFTEPLRGAAATDTYVASGDERDLREWQPLFTYHGFRYASVEGLEDCSAVRAAEIHTDVRNATRFRCGSATVNSVWEALVRTDLSNIHSIMTDCPQRDERMGWMNDATGRFRVSPYAIDTGRLFPKILRDIRNEQRPEGQFTCCCPFYYGSLPADPGCSSFLVAAREALMHTGNDRLVREVMGDLERWEDYLLSRSGDGIVDYSWYGDWAGPSYACVSEEDPHNTHTEGIMVSTGFSLYNCLLLEELARRTGLPREKYADNARRIGGAMLRRWWNDSEARFGTGSMGSQALALFLGIVPPEKRAEAARVMVRDLRDRDYRITTGNQLTGLLTEMLCEYGYADDAWRLMTREEYPSFGYMLQNEATTIWERYELKKDPGMNSHSHPMHGNALLALYSRIAGLTPDEPGWRRVSVRPCLPGALLSCHLTADTCMGAVSVRWARRYGGKYLWVQLPPGVTGTAVFEGVTKELKPGFHM